MGANLQGGREEDLELTRCCFFGFWFCSSLLLMTQGEVSGSTTDEAGPKELKGKGTTSKYERAAQKNLGVRLVASDNAA